MAVCVGDAPGRRTGLIPPNGILHARTGEACAKELRISSETILLPKEVRSRVADAGIGEARSKANIEMLQRAGGK